MTEKALAEQMIDDEQIERNKLAAARGWLADPPPPPPSPQPHDRADKWRRMYGQMPPANPEGFR
jgi:hypothetical protein